MSTRRATATAPCAGIPLPEPPETVSQLAPPSEWPAAGVSPQFDTTQAAPTQEAAPEGATPTEEGQKAKGCVKCGAEGYPYCKEHRASYQRDYVAQRAQMAANQGFGKGVEQMRSILAAEFARHGKVVFKGSEVAAAILHAPAPAWPQT